MRARGVGLFWGTQLVWLAMVLTSAWTSINMTSSLLPSGIVGKPQADVATVMKWLERVKPTRESGHLCPICNGGRTKEKTFVLSVGRGGRVRYRCFRANKCNAAGSFNLRKCEGDWTTLIVQKKRSQHGTKGFLPQPNSPHALEANGLRYMEKRGIGCHVLKRNKIHQRKIFCPQEGCVVDAIVFPYLVDGETVFEKYRAVDDKIFWTSRGGQKVAYGVDDVNHVQKVIIVEGEMDKLSVETAGLRGVISIQNGASSGLSLYHGLLKTLQAANLVVLATDCDPAGDAAARRLQRQLQSTVACSRVRFRDGMKDANEVLMKFGSTALREDIENAELWAPLPPTRKARLQQWHIQRRGPKFQAAKNTKNVESSKTSRGVLSANPLGTYEQTLPSHGQL